MESNREKLQEIMELMVNLLPPEEYGENEDCDLMAQLIKELAEQGGWQSANNPPEKSYPILIYCLGRVTRAGWYEGGKWWVNTDTGYREETYVTRWHKMPKNPK